MRIHFILFLLLTSLTSYSEDGKKLFIKAKKAPKNIEKVNLYIQSGDAYIIENKFSLAMKSYERAERKLKDQKDNPSYNTIKIKLANRFHSLGKDNKAIQTLLEAKELAFTTSNEEELIKTYELLAVIYKSKGDTVKTNEFINLKDALEDGLLSEDLIHQLDEQERLLQDINSENINIHEEMDVLDSQLVQTEKNLTKKEKDLVQKEEELVFATLENENKNLKISQQKAELKTEKAINMIFTIGFIFLIVIALIIFYFFRKIKNSNKIILKQKSKITSSITYAKRIQEAAMPQLKYIEKHIPQSFVLFKPKEIVSGDFFWMYKNPVRENSFFIAAVDCTGHGVPGAFMSMIGINQLNEIVSKDKEDVGEILDELNKAIIKALRQEETDNQDGMDMSLCRLDFDEKMVHFAGARNPLIYIENNEINIVKADRRGIGGVLKTRKKRVISDFKVNSIDASKVDAFYIFSDGVPDQIGSETKKKITTRKFSEKLLSIHKNPFNDQKSELWNFFNTWRGTEVVLDDVLVIGFKF